MNIPPARELRPATPHLSLESRMNFRYRALNADGGQVTGSVSAKDSREAIRSLKRQGLTVLEVKDATHARGGKRSKRRASKSDLMMYMHQLSTLVESRISLEDAVASLAESIPNEAVARNFDDLAMALRRGSSFSAALKSSGLPLPEYFHPLAESGELTGKLGSALRNAVDQWEEELRTSTELRNALMYPSILVSCGLGSVLLIFIVVVPKFVSLLDKTKGEVPLLAQIVLGLGKFFNENMLVVCVTIAVCLILIVYGLARKDIRQRLRDGVANIPFFNDFFMEADIGSWSNLLATLLDNRVSLIKALDLALRFVSLTSLRARMTFVIQSVRDGNRLAEALVDAGAITALGYNLVKVGESSGELPAMLRSLGTLYADRVRVRTKRFLTVIEPVSIIIIGAVVGLIMAGIILAITSVNDIPI